MKRDIKVKRFADVDEMKKKKTTKLLFGTTREEFKKCFLVNKKLDKCISTASEKYLEED